MTALVFLFWSASGSYPLNAAARLECAIFVEDSASNEITPTLRSPAILVARCSTTKDVQWAVESAPIGSTAALLDVGSMTAAPYSVRGSFREFGFDSYGKYIICVRSGGRVVGRREIVVSSGEIKSADLVGAMTFAAAAGCVIGGLLPGVVAFVSLLARERASAFVIVGETALILIGPAATAGALGGVIFHIENISRFPIFALIGIAAEFVGWSAIAVGIFANAFLPRQLEISDALNTGIVVGGVVAVAAGGPLTVLGTALAEYAE